MTSEIAIMNREAVALAADSAVTLGEGEKIWRSANKIFTLSKIHPVGIMVYGNAHFMGIPWETIIKAYRERLGVKYFDKIDDYAIDLIDFMINADDIITQSLREDHVIITVHGYYKYMLKELEQEIESLFKRDPSSSEDATTLSTSQFEEQIQALITSHFESWQKTDYYDTYSETNLKKTIKKYKKTFDKIITTNFENVSLDEEQLVRLRYIAASLFYKDHALKSTMISGIVIAGFGEKEFFPAANYFAVQGIIDSSIPYVAQGTSKIGENLASTVIPFAQKEMVHIFMEGVDRGYQHIIDSMLKKIIQELPQTIIDGISEMDDDKKTKLKQHYTKVGVEILNKLSEHLTSFREVQFTNPITQVVNSLPKTELALMAEALVNLTSLKRKVSMQAETVSGPIDVAIISKGDGFIWIKRKHYFESNLNPHFIQNYFRRCQ